MTNLISVHHIHKEWDQFALKDVSFELPPGYVMGFIGQNGAGKTTTIKLLLNMLRPDQGQIRLLGMDSIQDEEKIKDYIGVVMDQPYFVEDWNLLEVEKALAPFYRSWQTKQYHQLLQEFKLDPRKKVRELSRGMKVKLMIATALSHNARLLILDEPTSGLDPVAREELLTILTRYMIDEKRGILFSTHLTTDLERIADYITLISKGELLFSGLKDDLLEQYGLIKGGPRQLSPVQKGLVLGCREYPTGFEGLIRMKDSKYFSSDFLIEAASLDQIIIHLNGEEFKHV